MIHLYQILLFLTVLVNAVVGQQHVAVVTCPGESWSGRGGGVNAKPSTVIPAERINDGYCDCPLTGADEPNTEACSGSSTWPGVSRPSGVGSGSTSNNKIDDKVMKFSCPQQPKLKLALSRVNDGICDCCDGADESGTVTSGVTRTTATIPCKDNCQDVLRQERQLQQELEQKFKVGFATRTQLLTEYEIIRKEKIQEASNFAQELQSIEQNLEETSQKFATLERKWIFQRLDLVRALVRQATSAVGVVKDGAGGGVDGKDGGKGSLPDGLKGMISSLSINELTWWIIHACQIVGEMDSDHYPYKPKNKNVKTCIPLRLAGLDAGLWWEPESYAITTVISSTSSEKSNNDDDDENTKMKTLAQLLDYNLQNPDRVIWNGKDKALKLKTSQGRDRRRRLMEEYQDDEDYQNDYDEDYLEDYHYHDEYDNDDFDEEDYERYRQARDYRSKQRQEDEEAEEVSETKGDKREEILALIKSRGFSASRVRFLKRAGNLLNMIEELGKQQDDDEEEIDEDEKTIETPDQIGKDDQEAPTAATKDEKKAAKPQLQFDPMVLPMVKNQLQRRRDAIERGLNFAISAKVLLDSLLQYQQQQQRGGSGEGATQTVEQYLQSLAMSVLNHGKLSTTNVWELYLAVMPELGGGAVAQQVEDEDETCIAPWALSCPPKSIQREGTVGGLPPGPILEAAILYCKGKSSDQAVATGALCASDKVIPSFDIADGYFGYYKVYPRGNDDLFSKVFQGLGLEEDNSSERSKILEYGTEIKNLERDREDAKRKISNALDAVGGTGDVEVESTLGRGGELFSLKNQCFSYDAAKYSYELCLFRKAKQKESGNGGGGSSTHLGDWSGPTMDRETGERRWHWTRGTKCWNGPERSATALVTCGSQTRIWSADEPETCRYVFQVESPVACDEQFKAQNNL